MPAPKITSTDGPSQPPMAGARGPLAVALTIAFYSLAILSAIVAFAVLLVVHTLATPFDRERHLTHAYISRFTHGFLHLNPAWDVRIEGRERLPRGAAVIVANHQSAADVMLIMGLYHPFKFVSKHTLFSVPIAGWAMRLARYVPLQRGSTQSTKRMMQACRALLRRGVAVLIFPEGTYALGGRMLPFRRGAFALAIEERVPLVPVVIQGTPTLIWDDGPLLSPRARLRMTVMPPIPPEALGDDPSALAARVRKSFQRALGEPPDEGPPETSAPEAQ